MGYLRSRLSAVSGYLPFRAVCSFGLTEGVGCMWFWAVSRRGLSAVLGRLGMNVLN